ncbi:MAG: hypothetical protein COB35_10430 [Gammaproteobacteria bacterium]|nr:MAG: hypothetical protein COB35_10430 [Gammaproteobacteria bacterium]
MLNEVEVFSLVFILVSLFALIALYKRKRFKQITSQPLSDEYKQLLFARLPIYKQLSPQLKADLEHKIVCFLHTKQFIGCDLTITDEIKVTIAAEACLLIINRSSSCYAQLKWIYVYPSVFIAKQAQRNEYGIVSTKHRHLLGESWANGKVILAWDSVESGMANFHDGQNVVLHEFAHQLDQENGNANGAPLLYTKDGYRIWSQVFSEEFKALQQSLAEHKTSLIDRYGATNPAEFFAVVTELFFECPEQLAQQHAELFGLLQNYYRLDPRSWTGIE